MNTRVLNIRDVREWDFDTMVYIGRPSPRVPAAADGADGRYGNPFVVGKDGTREEVIEKYRAWADGQVRSRKLSLRRLKGKDLVCWCAPEACHGHVLAQLADASDGLDAIVSWFGGKRNLAPLIVDLLTGTGKHASPTLRYPKRYREPFHGSLAVLLELRGRGGFGEVQAVCSDLYGMIHNLAVALSDETRSMALYERLLALPFHETTWSEARRWLREFYAAGVPVRGAFEFSLDAAANYFVALWMGRNAEGGTEDDWRDKVGGFARRFTTSGGDPALRWSNAVAAIPEWHRRLCRRTQFVCEDGLSLIGRDTDGPDLMLYCDPPYTMTTRKGKRYAVDVDDGSGTLSEAVDFHSRLREALDRFREASVVVSYYDDPRLLSLYRGWRIVRKTVPKASSMTGEGCATATEILIHNQTDAMGDLID